MATTRSAHPTGASKALRMLIKKIALASGPMPGEFDATLYGELDGFLNWRERQAAGASRNGIAPGWASPGVSVGVSGCWRRT